MLEGSLGGLGGVGGAATIYTNETKIFDIRFFIVFTYQRF